MSSALPACRRFVFVFLWSAFSQRPACYRALVGSALAISQTRLAKRTLLGVMELLTGRTCRALVSRACPPAAPLPSRWRCPSQTSGPACKALVSHGDCRRALS